MIEKIPDLPDNVVGFTAKGTVTANDYESVIIPEVEAMFARQGKVRFLYHLGEEFTGLEPAAAWDDTKLGLKHLTGWEKVASSRTSSGSAGPSRSLDSRCQATFACSITASSPKQNSGSASNYPGASLGTARTIALEEMGACYFSQVLRNLQSLPLRVLRALGG